jgi:predicted Zn-ribbon and HTH transcriptional regulator
MYTTPSGETLLTKIDTAVLDNLKRDKIFTLPQLTSLLKCSKRTAQRRLTQWNVHTSYNFNGRFHALPTVPRFDHYGIWKYRDICFSRYGNLTETIIHLVDASTSGLTVKELCQILNVKEKSFRTFFSKIKHIHPEKTGHRLVYISSEQKRGTKQLNSRCNTEKGLPHDATAVLILVDRIKFPDSTIEECARRVGKRAFGVTTEVVLNLLDYHGLLKKTADTSS